MVECPIAYEVAIREGHLHGVTRARGLSGRPLGLPVAVKKREGPATCLGFLGCKLDSQVEGGPSPMAEAGGAEGPARAVKAKKLESLVKNWLTRHG